MFGQEVRSRSTDKVLTACSGSSMPGSFSLPSTICGKNAFAQSPSYTLLLNRDLHLQYSACHITTYEGASSELDTAAHEKGDSDDEPANEAAMLIEEPHKHGKIPDQLSQHVKKEEMKRWGAPSRIRRKRKLYRLQMSSPCYRCLSQFHLHQACQRSRNPSIRMLSLISIPALLSVYDALMLSKARSGSSRLDRILNCTGLMLRRSTLIPFPFQKMIFS